MEAKDYDRGRDREPVKCPKCNGNGRIYEYWQKHKKYMPIECDYCNGLEVVHRCKLSTWLEISLMRSK